MSDFCLFYLERLEQSIAEMEETLLLVTEQNEQSEREMKYLQTRVLQVVIRVRGIKCNLGLVTNLY